MCEQGDMLGGKDHLRGQMSNVTEKDEGITITELLTYR